MAECRGSLPGQADQPQRDQLGAVRLEQFEHAGIVLGVAGEFQLTVLGMEVTDRHRVVIPERWT